MTRVLSWLAFEFAVAILRMMQRSHPRPMTMAEWQRDVIAARRRA